MDMEASERPVRVLVVEDDQEIAQVLQRSLRMEGYEVKLTADGLKALDDTQAFLPDLIVLDLGLPGMDGIEVARQLRRDEDDTPILILTARDALDARVEGLDVGADDYLVKPFERQELLARMRALLRRRPPRGMAPLRAADLTLNPDTHEVTRGERSIDLTQREFELLEYLMRNERLVISRQRLGRADARDPVRVRDGRGRPHHAADPGRLQPAGRGRRRPARQAGRHRA